MKFKHIAFCLATLQPVFATTKTSNPRHLENSDCSVLIQDIQFADGHSEEKFVCEFEDGITADIVGEGADELAQLKEEGLLKSALTTVSGCQFKGKGPAGHPHECFLPPGFEMRSDNAEDTTRKRELAAVHEGTRTVLVVRVIATDAATSAAQSALGDSVFGTNGDARNLKSQNSACSHNKLNFVPATGDFITDGTTTVTVNVLTSETDSVMRPAITTALNQKFGVTSPSSLANHVMYCLPPNTMGGIAYAYINSWNSVYSDAWCTYLSAQMHEIGHNLGLAHSNEGTQSYADQSGMMGYSYSQDDGPAMCFNAAKSWQVGWYSDSHYQVDLDGQYNGPLVGITDYVPNGNTVIVKINTATATDYYVNFNRKTGFNSGTVEGGNQVMIVRAGGEGNSYSESNLLAKLNQGGSWSTVDGSGNDITVSVSSIDTSTGVAQVSIVYGNVCLSNDDCPGSTPCNPQVCNAGTCESAPVICQGTFCDPQVCDEATGTCVASQTDPCPTTDLCNPQTCNSVTQACEGSPVVCQGGTFCDPQTCDSATGTCVPGNDPCPTTDLCNPTTCNGVTEACEVSPVICNGNSVCGAPQICSGGQCVDNGSGENGVCDSGENCSLCPGDCPSFSKGAVCGDGKCEDGEDCVSCPQDCNGRLGGKPSNRYCCYGGPTSSVQYGVSCGSQCGSQCFTGTIVGGTTCCGDGLCEGPQETNGNCPLDCPLAPTPVSTPPPPPPPPAPTPSCFGRNSSCSSSSQCCSGKCKGNGRCG